LICGSGVGGDSDLICILANFLLVAGIGDASGEEPASGVCLSRLLYLDSHEDDAGEWHSRDRSYISSRRECGAALLLLLEECQCQLRAGNRRRRAIPGSRGGGSGLTRDRISPRKNADRIDAAHLNDGWTDVGGLSL
jgi:hypothetical protein